MRTVLVGLIALAILCGLSIGVGVADLSNSPEVLFSSRIPRTIAAELAGAGLAVSGLVIQLALRNRFVDPMMCGTGQGAVLGLLAVALLLPGAALSFQVLVSTLTALGATAGFWWLASRLPNSQYAWVPVLGLIYGGVLAGLIAIVAIYTDVLQILEIWLTGEFSGVIIGRYEWLGLIAVIVGALYFGAQHLVLLSLGEAFARGLGLNVGATMALCLLLIALVISLVTLTVGILPFLGLIVPNIVRGLVGDHPKKSLPLTALFGANLCLVSDFFSRLVVSPFEIPVSLTLGVCGALGFLVLVWRHHA